MGESIITSTLAGLGREEKWFLCNALLAAFQLLPVYQVCLNISLIHLL